VDLDKAAAVAKPVGLGAGIFAGFRVHPLLGVAIAGAGFLAKFVTDGYKKSKIAEVRQKWWRLLTDMNEVALNDFENAVRSRYPLLLPAARCLLLE